MKLTTCVAAFAFLDFVTADPLPTGLAAHNPVWSLLKRGARLVWDPVNAEEGEEKRKWEHICDEALTKAGCNFGTIHQPQFKMIRNGHETFYVNVEGASSVAMKNPKRMRVFEDGSAEDLHGWLKRDRKVMEAVKRKKRNELLLSKEKTALLSWNPPDSYDDQQNKKLVWEHACDEALTKTGCHVGIIHRGETKVIRNGRRTSYLNVEGAPSMDLMKNPKKMRVFQDGSSEEQNEWSRRDKLKMTRVRKLGYRFKDQPQKNRKALLFWSPADAYERQRKKKKFWEQRCDVALARNAEDCDGGTIFKGERRLIKANGEEVSYVNVEAAPSMGMEHGKNMRVFEDGSSEVLDDWSARDWKLMGDSRRLRRPVEDSTSSQAPTEEPTHDHAHAERSISWIPPQAYGKFKRFRQAFEKACLKALEREGCDYGILHKAYKTQENADGTTSNYLIVAAGKQNDPDGKKYMRLFEDGSSVWYPPGPLSKYDSKGGGGKNLNPLLSSPYRRKRGRPRKQEDASVHDNGKRTRVGGDGHQYSAARAHHAQASTLPESPGPSQAPRGDGGAWRDVNLPPAQVPAQAVAPGRFHASGGDGAGRLDLNVPPE